MSKVLYLEDELWQIEGTVATVLEVEYGHEVTTCSTIDAADQLLREQKWEVIVVDIMMDARKSIKFSRSGFVIIQRIRNGDYDSAGNGPALPIVCASGVWDMVMTWEDGDRIGVAEAMTRMRIPEEARVTKPLSEVDLDEAIRKAVPESGTA